MLGVPNGPDDPDDPEVLYSPGVPDDICPVTSVSYLVGWNRALLHFQAGLHCKVSKYIAPPPPSSKSSPS